MFESGRIAPLVAAGVLLCMTAAARGVPATAAAPPADVGSADPAAIVTLGRARFTILTPRLIRMEWAADGRFEDRASFVFINRRLPVPRFTHTVSTADGQLTIATEALTLTYRPAGGVAGPAEERDGFTADNLGIELSVDGKAVLWHPAAIDPDNLLGTTRTLDGSFGSRTQEPLEPGIVSRSGWALVDDSVRPLFDSSDFRFLQGAQSPWPWVTLRASGFR